jgi:hypothetical protein
MNERTLCNHAQCRCEIEEDEEYCSDYCREEIHTGMESVPLVCRCGHSPCGTRGNPAVST